MDTRILANDLCFGEGPRWHDGKLWFSDMHDHRVKTVTTAGQVEDIVEVDNRPSGLGWLPNGDLLIVSMRDRKLLSFDGDRLSTHADLSDLAAFDCNDMVVDTSGRAYVGSFGFDLHARAPYAPAPLIAVEPDGRTWVAAEGLGFPNGTVITPDAGTLIVAESFAGQLTAFDVTDGGKLENRRLWAELPQGSSPDGICLDAQGGVWVASPPTKECLRVTEGGEVTDTIRTSQAAYACMLGADDRCSLYVLTAPSSQPEQCASERGAQIVAVDVQTPGAGLP